MVQPLSALDFIALMPFYLEICFEFMYVQAQLGRSTLSASHNLETRKAS